MAFNFNNKSPKKILFNGKNVTKLIYNGIVVWMSRLIALVTGKFPLTLENSTGEELVDYKIYGESVQNGNPTIETPIEVESVGDKTINLLKPNTYRANNAFNLIGNATSYGVKLVGIPNWSTSSSRGFRIINSLPDSLNGKKVKVFCDSPYLTINNCRWESDSINTIFVNADVKETTEEIEVELYVIIYDVDNEPAFYEPYGYKIPVTVNEETTNIYLDEPLRKIGDYADYVDFENKKVVRNIVNMKLPIKDMNNSQNYPGWKNTNISKYMGSGSNKITEVYSNLCQSIGVNTTSGLNTIFFSTSNIKLTQTEFKELYPDLICDLNFCIITTPIEESIDLPSILTQKSTNIISIDTKIQPSDGEIKYWKG